MLRGGFIDSIGRRAFEKSGRRHLAHTCGPNCGISWVGRVDATFVWPSAGENWWQCGSPWRAEGKSQRFSAGSATPGPRTCDSSFPKQDTVIIQPN